MLARVPNSYSSKVRAYKKVVDGLVFVMPRKIPIDLNGQSIGVLERPLRAQTAQGERVALARSEMVPVGASICFSVLVLGDAVDMRTLREWLDYGALRGLGQWRNGSFGRFSYSIEETAKD